MKKLKSIDDLRRLIYSDVISFLKRVKSVEDKTLVLLLHNVVHSLWFYWSETGDQNTLLQLEYYEKKLFEVVKRSQLMELKTVKQEELTKKFIL